MLKIRKFIYPNMFECRQYVRIVNSLLGGTRPDDRRQTCSISVKGQSDSNNDELIDGIDNNERVIGTTGLIIIEMFFVISPWLTSMNSNPSKTFVSEVVVEEEVPNKKKVSKLIIKPWLLLLLSAASAASSIAVSGQDAAYERFRSNNMEMSALQPSWMCPIVQPDARLGQALRVSVSNFSAPGEHPIVYGNNQGFSTVLDRRFQFAFDPPSYFRNHSSTLKDGFGNAAASVKWRIASGNAQHGNFEVSAMLTHGLAPRAIQNGVYSTTWDPTLVGGRAFGRFAALTSIGGFLPTHNIWKQGRGIVWNATGEAHLNAHFWVEIENNALFLYGGPYDSKTQNFVTPGVFYLLRRASWSPRHASVIVDCGMQTATSGFHEYNHNLITELKFYF